jgi:Domain of unknown function (DUF5666)
MTDTPTDGLVQRYADEGEQPLSHDEPSSSEDDLEDEFLPRPPRRLATSSIVLIGCAAVAAGFLGGVLVQRHHDTGITRTTAATGRGTPAAAAGGRTGGFGAAAGEGFGTGTGGGAGGFGGGTGGTAGTGSAAGTTIPSLIGTVASVTPTTASVTNLGGQKVVVHLGKSTKLTAAYGTSLAKGESVSVYGSKAADGSITATAITVT